MALADTLKTDLNAPVVRPSQQYEKETIAPLREQMMTSLKSEEDVGRKKEIQQASSQANLSASMATYDTQASEKLHNDPNLIKYQEAIDQKSKAAFIPDQENPQRLATVLAITNLLGIAIGGKGKNSAQTALAAQNGMLEGYQQGRADIIKQQKDIFDTNQKQLDKTIENLHRGFQDALALAPTDRKAAEEKAMSTINQENADFLRELYNKTGLVGASKTIAILLKQAESLQKLMQQEEMKMIRTPHEIEMERQGSVRLEQGERGLDIRENNQGRGASTDRYGFGDIMAVASNEAAASVRNIMGLPMESTSGIFGGKQTNSLFTAPVDAFANQMTSESTQRYNSEAGKLSYNLAQLMKGGRQVGVNEVLVMDNLLKIKEGDTLETASTKLAEARQIAERAMEVKLRSPNTPKELKSVYEENLQIIRDVIPFTVDDINKFVQTKNKKQTFGDALKTKYKEPTGDHPDDIKALLKQYGGK
jgi:hypothetical protein